MLVGDGVPVANAVVAALLWCLTRVYRPVAVEVADRHLRALLRLIVGQVVNLAPSFLHCFAMLQAHTDLPTTEVGACTTEAALGSLRDLRGVFTRLARSRF